MNFQFSVTPKVIFGSKCSGQAGEIAASMGAKTVLCVYDQGVKNAGITYDIIDSLNKAGLRVIEFDGVLPNPTDTITNDAAEMAKREHVDVVVAIGGGSSIDCAKAINILLTNPGTIEQYYGVNRAKVPTKPLIAIPTTAGTGSEVTSAAGINDTVHSKKMGISGQYVGAAVALVDPDLTVGLPPAVTAATGMDALSHAIEAYVSKMASVPTDLNALKAIELICSNIREAVHNGSHLQARSNMLLGSTIAGFAFNSALLGLSHSLAHPLGGHFNIAHGVAIANVLPHVMEFNSQAEPTQIKLKNVARAMGLQIDRISDRDAAQAAIQEIKALIKELNIPTLRETGVTKEMFSRLADDALLEKFTLTNPVAATKEDLIQILEKAY